MRSCCSVIAIWLLAATVPATAQEETDLFNVRDFGAKGDGETDDTAAFQRALDAAGAARGGVVRAPRGIYYFAGHLNVPKAVTLAGVWESVPAHNGIRDRGLVDLDIVQPLLVRDQLVCLGRSQAAEDKHHQAGYQHD